MIFIRKKNVHVHVVPHQMAESLPIPCWFKLVWLDTSDQRSIRAWTNFSLQDEPWAEFSTLEVAACIPCTYCLV
jgi:hypothetical protein